MHHTFTVGDKVKLKSYRARVHTENYPVGWVDQVHTVVRVCNWGVDVGAGDLRYGPPGDYSWWSAAYWDLIPSITNKEILEEYCID